MCVYIRVISLFFNESDQRKVYSRDTNWMLAFLSVFLCSFNFFCTTKQHNVSSPSSPLLLHYIIIICFVTQPNLKIQTSTPCDQGMAHKYTLARTHWLRCFRFTWIHMRVHLNTSGQSARKMLQEKRNRNARIEVRERSTLWRRAQVWVCVWAPLRVRAMCADVLRTHKSK